MYGTPRKFTLALALIAGICASAADVPTPTTLRIVHFNAGNSDATLVILQGKGKTRMFTRSMLIDAGGADPVGAVQSQGISALDYAVATRAEGDSLTGIQRVVNSLRMTGDGMVFQREHAWPGPGNLVPGSQIDMTKVPNSLKNAGVASPADQQDFEEFVSTFRGRLRIECVAVNGQTKSGKDSHPYPDQMARSVAFKITFGRFRYFTGGNLTGGGPAGLATNPSSNLEGMVARDVGPVDVLRVDHHGSPTSTSLQFLSALNPLVAIISVDRTPSNDMQFGWQARAVLDRLVQSRSLQNVFITGDVSTPGGLTADDKKKIRAQQGDITVTTTGEDTFQVNGTTFNLPR